MTTQVSKKVRLVRCPKCRQVLAELPEVLLYQCGGCDTVLQAKNRRPETNSAVSSSQETNSVAKSLQDNASEASSSDKDSTSRREVESLSDKDNIQCQDEIGDSAELCEDRIVLSSSPEIAHPGNEDSSIGDKDFSKRDSLGQISKNHHNEFRDENGEMSVSRSSSDELPSSVEFTLEASEHVEQHMKDQVEGEESQRVWRKGDNFVEHEHPESVSPPEGKKDNHVSPENGDKVWICHDDQNGDFDGKFEPSEIVSRENQSISQSIGADDGAEKYTNASVCDSNVASRSPSKESLVSFYLSSPDDEHSGRSPREATCNFGRVSSLDTLGPMTNHPKNESYYAYDGSESSYDGTDYQIRERISPSSRKNNDVDIRTTETLRKNDSFFRANNNMVVNGETQWATSSLHRATRNDHWSQGKSAEINRLAFPSRVSPTSYRHSSLPPRPVFKPSSYSDEPDKIDLLRTVWELKDQLSRMQFPEVRKFAPFDRYEHFSPEREILFSDVHHPHRYNNIRHNQAPVCAEQCNVSRLSFSGEAKHYGPQVSCSCTHCCPQDWHYPSCHKNGLHGVHAHRACCNTPSSSNAHRYTNSEVPSWGYETKPNDDEMKRARLKEKYFAAKRHLRPVAGGAPVVTCYQCSELLHLPADFLLFERKYHRLMCNTCKKVLRFSVKKGTHIVPYVPGASAPPPPSEADEIHNDTMKPLSNVNSFQRADPVSSSDDYGRSFGVSSGSSYDAVEDRKMKSILTEPRNEDESLAKDNELIEPSSLKWRRGTSEIEEASSSPLHRLMGYSSPSQVLEK